MTLADVKRAFANKSEAYNDLHVAVYLKYKSENTATIGRAAGLIWRFFVEMKPGDIVVMPSGGSNKLAFGEVTDSESFEEEAVADDDVIYRKRRSVNWIIERDWYELDSNIYGAFNSPQALTQINRYGDYLDREMYALYTKGSETHVRLDIKTAGGIDGEDYFDMGHSLLALCRDFRAEAGIPSKGSKIEVRSNVQSPGIFEFITHIPDQAIYLASILTIAVFGGRIITQKLGGINIGTDGLLKGVSEFLNDRKKRQLLEDLRKNLHAMDANLSADLILRLTGSSPSTPSAPSTAPPPVVLPPASSNAS